MGPSFERAFARPPCPIDQPWSRQSARATFLKLTKLDSQSDFRGEIGLLVDIPTIVC